MAQIDTIEPGDGWVIFKVRDPEEASAKATVKLYDKVHGYLLTHRGYRVRTTLTFVADGRGSTLARPA